MLYGLLLLGIKESKLTVNPIINVLRIATNLHKQKQFQSMCYGIKTGFFFFNVKTSSEFQVLNNISIK